MFIFLLRKRIDHLGNTDLKWKTVGGLTMGGDASPTHAFVFLETRIPSSSKENDEGGGNCVHIAIGWL